jgi:hypothetical protein
MNPYSIRSRSLWSIPLVITILGHNIVGIPDTPAGCQAIIRDILGPDYFKTDLDNDNQGEI